MKASELRGKSPVELKQELDSLLKAQFSLRMQHATQQLSNNSEIRKVRRDIARLKTIASQKRAGGAASGKTRTATKAASKTKSAAAAKPE